MASAAIRFARTVVLLLLSALSGNTLQAAEQRYDYDPLGRLVRSVQDGQTNEYLYDPAGNLLEVTGGAAQPPTVTSGDLGDFRQNEYRQAAVSGVNLNGATLRTDHPGIRIDNIVASANAISFRVAVDKLTPLGAHQLYVDSAAGSVAVGMNVLQGYDIKIDPIPITLPPDNLARRYTARLAVPAAQDETYAASVSDPGIANITTGSLTYTAGQSAVEFSLAGMKIGSATLRLNKTNLIEPADFPITVTEDGFKSLFSRTVGVARGSSWQQSDANLVAAPGVGIVRGAPWLGTEDGTVIANSVGIVRGESYQQSESNPVISVPVGVVRGESYLQSENNLVTSPTVGITSP